VLLGDGAFLVLWLVLWLYWKCRNGLIYWLHRHCLWNCDYATTWLNQAVRSPDSGG
jgi:hypothetical protein